MGGKSYRSRDGGRNCKVTWTFNPVSVAWKLQQEMGEYENIHVGGGGTLSHFHQHAHKFKVGIYVFSVYIILLPTQNQQRGIMWYVSI